MCPLLLSKDSRCSPSDSFFPRPRRSWVLAWHHLLGLVPVPHFTYMTRSLIVFVIVGCWYPRHLQGRRYAVLYSTVSLTGAFGGLLATAIHSLDGNHGIAGWRWIFIVEGCVTSGLGLFAYLVMSDYPRTASWLTDRERIIVEKANEADRALHAEEAFSSQEIKSAFTDWRTYLWGLVYLSTYIPVYSVVLSLPSVVAGLGYKGTTATLMACPPYAFGFVIVITAGYTTDKFGKRYFHLVASCILCMIALIVLMTVTDLKARYGMFFLMM
jgi:sugar phosphate permease